MVRETNDAERPLRADAARNRTKILEAAAQVFAQRGLEATLDDVAEAAGVGVATVYRRFPDKGALVVALFEDAVEEIAALARRASDFEDSWAGLTFFIEEVLQRECANQGLRDVIVGSPYARERMALAKQRIGPVLGELIARAQREGLVRADLVESDVLVIEMMISTLGGAANKAAPDLWRRYLALALDALVTRRDAPRSLPAAPSAEVVLEALRASTARRGALRA